MILILVGVSLPIGVYLWRESRRCNPAVRWSELAESIGFTFSAPPPRLTGKWKGRMMTLTANENGTILSCPLQRKDVRLEVGEKSRVERESGMIVPDRIDFSGPGASDFSARFMLRSTPPEVGRQALDPALRKRLLEIAQIHVLAEAGTLRIEQTPPTEEAALRDSLDLAEAFADLIDGA